MEDNIYIIGTTSINRSDLHNIVIPKWKNWVIDSGRQIKWFINIDILEYLQESYEFTKKNFEYLLEDSRIELIILQQQHNKFLGACKNLSENIKNYVENNNLDKNNLKIIWLEDDWDLKENSPSISELEKYCCEMCHLNLSGIKNNYIWALAPSISTYNFWVSIFYEAWKNQKIDLCPEKSVGNYYQSKYCNHENTPNIILLREKVEQENIKNMIFKNTRIIHLNTTEDDKQVSSSQNLIQPNMEVSNCLEFDSVNEEQQSTPPVFIKLFPNISFDIGIEYMKSKNITKQFVKKNRNQIVIDYNLINKFL